MNFQKHVHPCRRNNDEIMQFSKKKTHILERTCAYFRQIFAVHKTIFCENCFLTVFVHSWKILFSDLCLGFADCITNSSDIWWKFSHWWLCNGQHWLVVFLWKRNSGRIPSTPLYHYSEYLFLFKKISFFQNLELWIDSQLKLMVQRCGADAVRCYFFIKTQPASVAHYRAIQIYEN